MKVTLNWIKEFLEVDDLDPVKISELLTMSGTEVKRIDHAGNKYKNIVIGKVNSFRPHPNADKLSLCKVDVGTGILGIVCGADNFKEGDRVPVALAGAQVGDLKIKKSKIRGEISEGMMCSGMELGLSSDADGIMILDDSFETGMEFRESAGLNDIVFELEITPNRPDCLSIIGIAREISALIDVPLIIPEYDLEGKINIDGDFIIEIEDHRSCPRYSAKVFNNIPDIPSPLWLKNRLALCDVRSVDLIVDLTNYVMLETGQPMHAFDKDLLHSNKIIVRNAGKNEEIQTIDDNTWKLDKDDLVIADEKGAVAIAGIMGGKKTEINPGTRNVLLESANFFGPSIMRTSKKIGLRSEASNRFEKKIDPMGTTTGIQRFSFLLSKIAKCGITDKIYDNFDETRRERKIILDPERVRKVLGKKIDPGTVSSILSKLKIKNSVKGGSLEAIVPSFRYEDLERDIDLIEEVARIYGYNNFDSIPTKTLGKRGKYNFYQQTARDIKQALSDIGLHEVINYSFISRREMEELSLEKDEDYKNIVKILNPINEDYKILRPSLFPSMIKTIKSNINYNWEDIKIFEVSKIFKNNKNEKLPFEINTLGIMLTGSADIGGWNTEQRNFDFYDLKGILEYLCSRFYTGYDLKIIEKEYGFFHPRISGRININGQNIGIIGKLNPVIAEEIDLKQDVYYLEMDLDLFINGIEGFKKFGIISQFPSIDMDIAIVVDEAVKSEDIIEEIKKNGSGILKNIRLFDIYSGKQIEANKKSMAYSLRFRDDSRTLKDNEIQVIINRILEGLGKRFNAKIRD